MTPIKQLFLDNPKLIAPKYLQKNYPEFYRDLQQKYPGKKLSEQVWLYFNGQPEVCPICGNATPFWNFLNGYRKFCSKSCANRSEESKLKSKQTCIKRYGVEKPAQATIFKEKTKQTCIERYGVDHQLKNQSVRQKVMQTNKEKYGTEWIGSSEELIEKRKQTCLERYGLTYHNNPEKNKRTNLERYGDENYNNPSKYKQTCIERYGVENPMQCAKHKSKVLDTFRSNFIESKEFLLGYTPEGDWICKCPHPDCNKCTEKYYISNPNIQQFRSKTSCETCTRLKKINGPGSTLELTIAEWLDEWDIQYRKDCEILDGKEIDFYIPSLNIGIECNGCYWHSEQHNPDTKRHLNKFLKCKDKGVRLIQIWEDWMKNKPEIVKSFLASKLGVCDKTIYARQCIVKEVKGTIAAEFLNKNHIQGRCNSKIKLGLYNDGKLVALMCFSERSKLSGSKTKVENEWELIRFCNLAGMRVIGGASKLLKHFIREYHPSIITSFSCNDISDGGLYRTLGFEEHTISTSYWYVHCQSFRRFHRSTFTRSGIIKFGLADPDEKWTERSVMLQSPFYRIHDSGLTKWVLKM